MPPLSLPFLWLRGPTVVPSSPRSLRHPPPFRLSWRCTPYHLPLPAVEDPPPVANPSVACFADFAQYSSCTFRNVVPEIVRLRQRNGRHQFGVVPLFCGLFRRFWHIGRINDHVIYTIGKIGIRPIALNESVGKPRQFAIDRAACRYRNRRSIVSIRPAQHSPVFKVRIYFPDKRFSDMRIGCIASKRSILAEFSLSSVPPDE